MSRECLFSFLNHKELNYPTKEQKGMPPSSLMLPSVVRQPFWKLLKTHVGAWTVAGVQCWGCCLYEWRIFAFWEEGLKTGLHLFCLHSKKIKAYTKYPPMMLRDENVFIFFLIPRLLQILFSHISYSVIVPPTPYFWGENIRCINRKNFTLL